MTRSAAALVVVIAFLVGYGGSARWVIPEWLDFRGHYGHGLLVVAMFVSLVWRARFWLPGNEPDRRVAAACTAGIAFSGAAWLLSVLAGVQSPTVLTALVAGWLTLGAVLGRGALLRLAPCFALLFAAIPIWKPLLNPVLQAVAVNVVNYVLRAAGLTIYMEGNNIFMPAITFEIAGGCSGLGYLLTAFSLSVYTAYSYRFRPVTGVLLVGAFLMLAMISNWLRIAMIMVVGYNWGRMHPLVYDHVWFGWIVFSALLLPSIFFVIRSLPAVPVASRSQECVIPSISARAAGGYVLLLMAFPGVNLAIDLHARVTAMTPPALTPQGNGHYREVTDRSGWAPSFPGATHAQLRAYLDGPGDDATTVHLFQARYADQRIGAAATDRENDLVNPGWLIADEQMGRMNLQGEIRPMRTLQASNGAGFVLLVWSWYRVGDTYAPTTRAAKIARAWWKLRLRPDAALVAVAARCEDARCDSARESLTRFVAVLEPDS